MSIVFGGINPPLKDLKNSKSTGRLSMATAQLPQDFKEFLKLLNEERLEYLLVGGYAVGYYGYPRATADMDIWIAISTENAEKALKVFHRFGLNAPDLTASLFLEKGRIIRMGIPPMRIEIITDASGVSFADCYKNHSAVEIDGISVHLISLPDLLKNKKAAGRYKDLDDLEHLSRK